MKTDKELVHYDVQVMDGFKSFGENNVLNGLNMKVRSCTIYGLLGPSGCGKSTLLQCILGIKTLDSGCIDLKTKCLKDVGYMPQNLCLEETLTIRETFEYYGTLYSMSNKQIQRRIKELNRFLKLPDLSSYINEISGGQSRRVSLAISLLHDPKVIILDEPTVGIDPLLRQEIWAEFTKMVEQHKKTIIITTHYIEEANQANCIGLMRHGILVEEGTSRFILKKYGADSLEISFLKLCRVQENNEIANKKVRVQAKTQSNKLTKFESNVDLYRIKALLKKNYHVCSRDYLLIFTVALLPILQTFNFCFGIGVNFKDMPIAVKNDEINILDCKTSNVGGCIFDENNNMKLSCVILNYLTSRDYTLFELKDREGGERKMMNSNYMAFLYFPKNFSSDLTKYIGYREYIDNEFQMYAHLTKENFLFRNQITMDMINAMNYLIGKSLKDCSYNSNVMNIPLKFNILFGHEVKSYGNGIVSLFIAMLAFYFPSVYSVTIMMSEKMDGILSRSMFAGVKLLELVISMFCINTIIFLIQMIFVCLISYKFFENPIQLTNGLFVYVIIMLFLGWIGFLFGLLTAVLSPTKISGVYVITGSSISQFLLSGAIWPMEGQPYLLRKISELLPIRLVGNTMNNIALKGWTLSHSSIVIGTTATFAYTILLVLVLIVLGKLKKDLWVIHK